MIIYEGIIGEMLRNPWWNFWKNNNRFTSIWGGENKVLDTSIEIIMTHMEAQKCIFILGEDLLGATATTLVRWTRVSRTNYSRRRYQSYLWISIEVGVNSVKNSPVRIQNLNRGFPVTPAEIRSQSSFINSFQIFQTSRNSSSYSSANSFISFSRIFFQYRFESTFWKPKFK